MADVHSVYMHVYMYTVIMYVFFLTFFIVSSIHEGTKWKETKKLYGLGRIEISGRQIIFIIYCFEKKQKEN